MSNPVFNIEVGDIFTVTEKDDYPDDNHCHWYELTSKKTKISFWMRGTMHLTI